MKHWKEATGKDVEITQFHGGSGKQALEVVNGLEADVVTLALEYDVNIVRDAGLIENGWVKDYEIVMPSVSILAVGIKHKPSTLSTAPFLTRFTRKIKHFKVQIK